ncbi:MAG: radical SAM/SPASM domain-containing protein [Rhodospirillales bacterium]
MTDSQDTPNADSLDRAVGVIDEQGERASLPGIAAMRFSDFESEMAELHGPRFVEYRRNYRKSLSYHENGYLPDFPLTLQLELVNRCNLSCIMCYTENHKKPKAALSIDSIRAMTAEAKKYDMPAMVLGMGSEALLYKDFRSVIDAADDGGVMDLIFGCNGVLLNEGTAQFLIDRKVARCWVSLDAATPETFKKIRGKDELEKVEDNIRRLCRMKKEQGARFPNVRISFCVQEDNHHEREAFIQKWRGVVDHIDFQQLIEFDHIDTLLEHGDVSEPLDPPPGVDLDKPVCQYPFNSLNVWSNGDVSPCCTFYGRHLVVGNANEESLKSIWDGEKINRIRDEFRTGDLNPTCRVCLCARDDTNFEDARKTAAETNAVKTAAE